jgi:hypothetical protein
MQSRVEILEDLLDSEPTPEEAAVISQLFRQPRIQRLLSNNVQHASPVFNTSLPTSDMRSESESISVQEEAGGSNYLHSPTSAHELEDEELTDGVDGTGLYKMLSNFIVDESILFARRGKAAPGGLLMEDIPRIPFPPMRQSTSHTQELELHSFLDGTIPHVHANLLQTFQFLPLPEHRSLDRLSCIVRSIFQWRITHFRLPVTEACPLPADLGIYGRLPGFWHNKHLQ